MPTYEEEPVVERRVVREPARDNDLTSYAFVKYAFILAITIVILYFLAQVVIPAF